PNYQLDEANHFAARLESLGYQVNSTIETIGIRKPAQVESVVNELVPLCEEVGVDPHDIFLVEYDEEKPAAYYQEGKFYR
ncbi:MAG: hypothetical protein SCK28_11645, partial [Bacillota bacterium]|nr:hypothetical protein [Bacillota bacterium]